MASHDSSHPPSLQRLSRLVARRAERKLMSETGSAPPTPSLTEEIESSLRRKHRSAKIIDEVVSAARSRGASSTPGPRGPTYADQHRQPSNASVPRRAGATPDPYLRYKVTPTPHLPVEVDGKQEDTWALMARQAAEEAKAAEVRARLERAKKIEEQRRILDDQCYLRSFRGSERKKQLVEERGWIEKDAEAFNREQREAADRRRAIAGQVKRDREEQAAAKRARRDADEAERKRQEAEILRRIQLELEVEQRRKDAARERDVRFKDELIAANEQQKAIKQRRAAAEAEEEAKYVEQYDQRLRKQEEARLVAWNAMKAKMHAKEATAFNLQATLDDKAAQDEARAAAETARREAQQAAKLEEERRQRHEAELLVRECQAEQIRLRNATAEAERQKVADEIHEVRQLTQREKEEEARERAHRAEVKRKQKEWLAEQMRIKNRQQEVIISEEERRLNAALLERSMSRSRDRPLDSP